MTAPRQLCGPDTELLMSYEERQSREKLECMENFFQLMAESFTWTKVMLEEQHPEYRSEDIQIVSFRSKRIVEVES